MEKKSEIKYENNYIMNNNENSMNNDNYSQYRNMYYYQKNQKTKNNAESPKVMSNKINIQNNISVKDKNNSPKIIYHNNEMDDDSFQNQNNISPINKRTQVQSFQLTRSINQNLSFSGQKPLNNFQQSFEEMSFENQKQSFELNLNEQNYIENSTNMSNIVNIDNQSSAFELCFIAKKKKKKYKTTTLFQAGDNQTALCFSFIAEKPNKYQSNKSNDIKSNGQNLSFISSKLADSNNDINQSKQDIFLSVPKHKNSLKIMTDTNKNGKNNILKKSKPKPVLQIVTNNKNKKLQDNSLSNINGFPSEDNKNNKNVIVKNNYVFISKTSPNEISNNNNQDLSFLSSMKEAENLLGINGINDNKIYSSNSRNISPQNNKQIFSIGNGMGRQLSDSGKSNIIYNNYSIINRQFCYLSEVKEEDKKYINNTPNPNNYCSSAKKTIKFEYYENQPTFFQINPSLNYEELLKAYEKDLNNLNKREFTDFVMERVIMVQFCPYKMFRVNEIEYIFNQNESKNDDEDDKDFSKSEDLSEKIVDNNNKGKKRRKRRKKK